MATRTVTTNFLRTNLSDVVRAARYGGHRFIVTTAGDEMIVILGIREYRSLVERAALPREEAMELRRSQDLKDLIP